MLASNFQSPSALRIEWCKARARAHHWQEECLLLDEEMGHVLRYFSWRAEWWKNIAEQFTGHAPDGTCAIIFREGRRAYALRQAAIQTGLKAHCIKTWDGLSDQLKKGEHAAQDIDKLVK